ncbi:MAG: hypothetical protein KGI78_02820 [Patescibacteria group bacterium]|nr:hypothetical protein [Patescibacteria group bacterium]MDE1944496.1 hypothetical protein [Patescibacteria group bacterium]MDE2057762.1 hypothetical protein [Patescibacteria group bacterium]
MAAVLSPTETNDIRQLRDAGVLQTVDEGMMARAREGTIFIPCADGHHFDDLFRTHLRLCGCPDNEDRMHHPLSLNGGALLLPESSPLRRLDDGSYGPDDEVLLRHLVGAIKLKQPQSIILYAHAPCGMARLFGLSIMEEFELLVRAKQRVREHVTPYGVTDVRAWFHVYYSDDRNRKTYHFRRDIWELHRAQCAA